MLVTLFFGSFFFYYYDYNAGVLFYHQGNQSQAKAVQSNTAILSSGIAAQLRKKKNDQASWSLNKRTSQCLSLYWRLGVLVTSNIPWRLEPVLNRQFIPFVGDELR